MLIHNSLNCSKLPWTHDFVAQEAMPYRKTQVEVTWSKIHLCWYAHGLATLWLRHGHRGREDRENDRKLNLYYCNCYLQPERQQKRACGQVEAKAPEKLALQ